TGDDAGTFSTGVATGNLSVVNFFASAAGGGAAAGFGAAAGGGGVDAGRGTRTVRSIPESVSSMILSSALFPLAVFARASGAGVGAAGGAVGGGGATFGI